MADCCDSVQHEILCCLQLAASCNVTSISAQVSRYIKHDYTFTVVYCTAVSMATVVYCTTILNVNPQMLLQHILMGGCTCVLAGFSALNAAS